MTYLLFGVGTGSYSLVRQSLDQAIEIEDRCGLRFCRAMACMTLGHMRDAFEDIKVYMQVAHPEARQFFLMSFNLALRVLRKFTSNQEIYDRTSFSEIDCL
jgi:hypothetical protein